MGEVEATKDPDGNPLGGSTWNNVGTAFDYTVNQFMTILRDCLSNSNKKIE